MSAAAIAWLVSSGGLCLLAGLVVGFLYGHGTGWDGAMRYRDNEKLQEAESRWMREPRHPEQTKGNVIWLSRKP